MNDKIKSVVNTYEFNNSMFAKLTKDITDEQATKVLEGCTNSFAWIVGHVVGSRHFVASLAGSKAEFPHTEYRGGKDNSYDPEKTYHKLSELVTLWDEQSASMMEHLPNMTDEQLSATPPFDFPYKENNIANSITFMLMHESFHLGQLSTYRKNIGLEWDMTK